jgi:hypothetical protein
MILEIVGGKIFIFRKWNVYRNKMNGRGHVDFNKI